VPAGTAVIIRRAAPRVKALTTSSHARSGAGPGALAGFPLSWRQTAEQLAELRPGARWTAQRVAHMVANVRARLSNSGVPNLTRAEVGEQLGNTLDHNLIHELMVSTTLAPWDLAILDPD
jgi:hypothetical protein